MWIITHYHIILSLGNVLRISMNTFRNEMEEMATMEAAHFHFSASARIPSWPSQTELFLALIDIQLGIRSSRSRSIQVTIHQQPAHRAMSTSWTEPPRIRSASAISKQIGDR